MTSSGSRPSSPSSQVLIMTIQNEPPSLKSYPDGEKGVDGETFSRGFRELIRLCLQVQFPHHSLVVSIC